jgi:putative tryptophan/tyrosine transport system substrate-binding protein
MTTRRETLALVGAAALGLPLPARAQKLPLIGYITPILPPNNTDARFEAFRDGMHELGYVEGKNYRLEVRWGEGKLDRMPALAAELVKMKPDIIVAQGSPSVLALHQATRTVPVVSPTLSDPVGDGLVASLAHPGGNITGLSLMAPELGRKRLQLLKEVLSKQSRAVAVLWNPAYKGMNARFRDAQQTAPSIGIDVRSLEVSDARQMEAAFDAVAHQRPDGLLLLADPLTLSMRARIVEFAREERLPAIYETREFADAGGLMSYGPNIIEQHRRAAYYVDKILKGAKPAELPIEQPAKIELVVNLRTARALGLTIPPAILASADQIIE